MFSSNFQTKDSLQNGVPASDSRMFGQAPLSTKWRWPASWSGMLGARKTRRQTLAHIKWPFYTGAGASHSVGEISRGIVDPNSTGTQVLSASTRVLRQLSSIQFGECMKTYKKKKPVLISSTIIWYGSAQVNAHVQMHSEEKHLESGFRIAEPHYRVSSPRHIPNSY